MSCKNIILPLALFLSTCLMTFLYFNTVSIKIEVHTNYTKTSITKIWTDKKEAIKGNLHRYLTNLRRRGRPYSKHDAKYGTGEEENSLHNYKPSSKRDKG